MTIKFNNEGFTSAELNTKNSAIVEAKWNGGYSFLVGIGSIEDPAANFFNQDACHEAAEFFLKLADELKRREAA